MVRNLVNISRSFVTLKANGMRLDGIDKIAAEIGDLNNSMRNNLEKSVLQQEQQIALISNEVY